MKSQRLLELLGEIDDQYILEAAPSGKKSRRHTVLGKWGAIAACALVLLAACFGSWALEAEAKEYQAAVQFFRDYGMSTDGLSRADIIAVYRDITTESFTFSKTAEVIKNSLSANSVSGYEIEQDQPTPEETENLWNYWNHVNQSNGLAGSNQEGVHYTYSATYKMVDSLGYEIHDTSYLEKYDGETFLWRVEVTDFRIDGYCTVSDGVIVFGQDDRNTGRQDVCAWLMKIDTDGRPIWQQRLQHGFCEEYVADIVENEDGSYAVFSRGDLAYFCLSQYAADGTPLHVSKTEIGNCGIWQAARIGEGYIVQLGSPLSQESMRLVKVDYDGTITEAFSYSSKDAYYTITDMIEFRGRIYLSAYAVPKGEEEENSAGDRYEIDDILQYLYENDIYEISSEELTPLVRENYTALLLECDPVTGTPQTFYSVKGSLGGKLCVNGTGTLLWNVESITSTYYSPATSAFTIGGTSTVFRYTFDEHGQLLDQEKTGDIVDYRR